jgi:hypothetical protein
LASGCRDYTANIFISTFELNMNVGCCFVRTLCAILVIATGVVDATELKNPTGIGDWVSEDKNWESKWSLKQKILIYGGCLVLGWVLKHKVLPVLKKMMAPKSS